MSLLPSASVGAQMGRRCAELLAGNAGGVTSARITDLATCAWAQWVSLLLVAEQQEFTDRFRAAFIVAENQTLHEPTS